MRLKRAIDAAVSLVALTLTLPFSLLAALLVWLEDRHSPIYVSLRVRDAGSTFPMYKFRSMVPDADRIGGVSTAANDRRLTRVGRFIRAGKLDELPQLLNVFIGDMSLVGPRPQVVQDAARYTAEENGLFLARPGMTDFASIVFADEGKILAGSDNPDETYDMLIRPWKSRLGLFYVERRTLWVDAALVVLTVTALVSRRRALRGVQSLLRRLGADESLVEVAGRERPLMPAPPPGDGTAVNGPYLPLTFAERAGWIMSLEQFRRGPIVVLHLLLIVASNISAWLLRHDGRLPSEQAELIFGTLPWLVLIRSVVFIPFRLYQGLWRYTGIYDLQSIAGGVAVSTVIFIAAAAVWFPAYSLSVTIIDALVLVLLLGGIRLGRRTYLEFGRWPANARRVLIAGAGDAGEIAARELRQRPHDGRRPIGFVDDAPLKIGRRIHGIPVLGGSAQLQSIVLRARIDEIVVATRDAYVLGAVDAVATRHGLIVTGRGVAAAVAPPAALPAFEPTMSEPAASSSPVDTCPRCHAAGLHRSRARTVLERIRKHWSLKRLFRCPACGWRGWREPYDEGAGGSLYDGPIEIALEEPPAQGAIESGPRQITLER